jgi:hypothetical protein
MDADVATDKKVADLTVAELTRLIREVVEDALAEFADEDDLEYRPEFVTEIELRLADRGDRASLEDVRRELGSSH